VIGSFVVRNAGATVDPALDAACVELWVRAVATRDGVPASPSVRERAQAKAAVPRVALAVASAPDAPTAGFVLVTEPGTGGGPASTETAPAPAYLSLLAVAPEAQGHGLGRRLLAAGVQAAADAGHAACELHALDDNEPALALYRSAGFHPVGALFPHALNGRPTRTWVASATR
jgi:ribosomal-protein-alanine N-acetyltransferase